MTSIGICITCVTEKPCPCSLEVLAKILIPGKVSSRKVVLSECTKGDDIPPVMSHSLSAEMTWGWVSHHFAPAEAGAGRSKIFGSRRGSVAQNTLKEAEGGFFKTQSSLKPWLVNKASAYNSHNFRLRKSPADPRRTQSATYCSGVILKMCMLLRLWAGTGFI